MKKTFRTIIIVLFVLGFIRMINGAGDLNLQSTIEKVRRNGNFFNFDEIYLDIQYTKFNMESLRNCLSAENGEQYRTYNIIPYRPGPIPGGSIEITNKEDEVIAYAVQRTEKKPDTSDLTETIKYIGNFLKYIGRAIMYIGKAIVDTMVLIVRTAYGIVQLGYYLVFT